MPLSREQIHEMLDRCTNSQERLLSSLAIDLEGRIFKFENLKLSDFDRASGIVRVHQESTAGTPVRLTQRTIQAFHEYLLSRKDNNPALFVSLEGKRQTEEEIRKSLYEIAVRSGLTFDEASMQFRSLKMSQPVQRLVAKGVPRDLFFLYGIVSNPIRRQIVDVLGDEGPLGFSQIRKRINAPVGTLYYHFDMLQGLVSQGVDKRYGLTEAGRDAYKKIHSAEYVQSSELLAGSLPDSQGPAERIGRILLPTRVIREIQSATSFAIIGMVLILGLGSFLVYQARLETVIFFLNPSSLGLSLTLELESVVLELEFFASWLFIYAVSDAFATFLYGRKGEHLVLLLGTTYSLLPMVFFAGYWDIVQALGPSVPGVSTIALSRIVLLILQAWSLALLARIVSSLKGLRLDKAAVVSLALAYLGIMIAFVQGV